MPFELTERIERHLAGDIIAWLTTVTPAGRPAPRPVWFVWDGAAITIYSLNNSAKLRHIDANDQVTVHFNSTPDGGDVVVIGGRASRIPDAPPPSGDELKCTATWLLAWMCRSLAPLFRL